MSENTKNADNFLYSIIIVSLLGLLNALYLFYMDITNSYSCPLTGGIFDCESVGTSEYAKMFGIPVSLFGVFFFILLLILTFLKLYEVKWQFLDTYLLGFYLPFLTLFGVLFSTYLTLIEIFVLQLFCEFCLLSALITVILFLLVILTKYREYGSLFVHLCFWKGFSR